jgi:hypothetical protein
MHDPASELRRTYTLRLSEKSQTGPQLSLRDNPNSAFRPFWPPYTGQIHAQCVARAPLSDSFRKRTLQTSPVQNSRKLAEPRSYAAGFLM